MWIFGSNIIMLVAAMHLMACITIVGPYIEFVELDTYQQVLSILDNYYTFEDVAIHVSEQLGLVLQLNEKRLLEVAK